ncbi:MAG: ABC transporter substrate-binding protein [Spirochaetales bacterium]|nr:ABC transporter substrate-binding protein [Spirochaetales bacterium]
MFVRKKIILLLLIVTFFISCNNNKNLTKTSYTDSYGRKITIKKKSEKPQIISIAPSMTELFFQLDNGESLIARSNYCDYPPNAKKLPSIGSIIEPNIEYIIALKPNLIVAADHFTKESVHRFEQLNIPVYIGKQGENLEDFYQIIRDMGQIIEKNEKAETLINKMQLQVAEIKQRVQNQNYHPKVYYMISFGESGDYTAGKNTFIANLIRIAGGINIADDTTGWGYSREKLFSAQPDMILTSRPEIKEQLKKDSIYSKLQAVQNNNVYCLEKGTIERPSVRNIEALLELENIFFTDKK